MSLRHTFEDTLESTNSFGYRIRFEDCDPFGHLNNANYFNYLLHGLEDYFREIIKIDFGDYISEGYGWMVKNHQIAYLRPAAQNEKIRIVVDLVTISEFELETELKMFGSKSHKLKAILKTSLIHFDVSKRKRCSLHINTFFTIAQFVNININPKDSLNDRILTLRNLHDPVSF